MPTYEYECSKCHKGFEIFQSMKDDALATCPKDKCRQKTWGRGKVKRKLGVGAGFIFKGSGFYITDYRSEGYKSGKKNDTAKPASTESAKTETPKADPAKAAKPSPPPAAKKEA
jgi:putative FmdB family regulatory protein